VIDASPLLRVAELRVQIDTRDGTLQLLRGVGFHLEAGRTLALVGESGSGKSMTALAIMGLLEPPLRISDGRIIYGGQDLLASDERVINALRGDRMAMIFQDPMGALNPTMRVGDQIAETLVAHRGLSWRAARGRAIALLDRTGIADSAARARQYPFELSGGMLQRAMIAGAIACSPDVLIADEPTTALDVTVQEQVLDLLAGLQRADGMAMLLITHDLGVVARAADDVAVMYAGQVVEQGPVEAVFGRAAHPYTVGLRNARPRIDDERAGTLIPIPGIPPQPRDIAPGCAFAPRCAHAMRICGNQEPPLFEVGAGHTVRCWLQHPFAATQHTCVAARQDAAQ
jgi:oligopeptide/dipeptide ABC transporter ATP-binding protein